MADSIKSIDSLVKQIVNRLDCNDNPEKKADGFIKFDEWNKFADGKGKTVEICISVFNAEKSVKYYLKQQAGTEKEKMDFAQKWLDKLIESDNEKKTKNIKKEPQKMFSFNIQVWEPSFNIKDLLGKAEKSDLDLSVKDSAAHLKSKWKGIWKNSNLSNEFYEKLFDIIPKLNLKVDKFDSKHFNSPEEQIADRLCLLFAEESKLNSKTKCFNENGNIKYAGIFQLANDTISGIKRSANVPKVSELMTDRRDFKGLAGFAKLSGVEQLDWLIAFCHHKGILDTPKTVDELAAKIKCCSTGYASKVLRDCEKGNNVPKGIKTYLKL